MAIHIQSGSTAFWVVAMHALRTQPLKDLMRAHVMSAALSATNVTSSSSHPFHDPFPLIDLVGRAISTEHATMSELYSGT